MSIPIDVWQHWLRFGCFDGKSTTLLVVFWSVGYTIKVFF